MATLLIPVQIAEVIKVKIPSGWTGDIVAADKWSRWRQLLKKVWHLVVSRPGIKNSIKRRARFDQHFSESNWCLLVIFLAIFPLVKVAMKELSLWHRWLPKQAYFSPCILTHSIEEENNCLLEEMGRGVKKLIKTSQLPPSNTKKHLHTGNVCKSFKATDRQNKYE